MNTEAIITQLEADAASVKERLSLGGKRPLFLEFAGTPKSGKTTVISCLDLFLRRNGFKVKWLVERASTSPISNKQHMFFNVWTAATTLSSMLAAMEDDVDVIIMDRGIYDAIAWMVFLRSIGRLQDAELEKIKAFLLLPRWRDLIDIVFVMKVEPHIALGVLSRSVGRAFESATLRT